ncbi:TonB-dependent receptor domain-containing protein [Hyphomicrobium sp. LHD-15]|uniref:TonB-dependent receptor n=1 Tax=Hyphomicrobium sp. LHD-15 TaxID=3072142 RepID=UPI00280D0FB0|nr:TonB-dependent receptor [Hyphomicrobium sp. LHD-15]MDQ8699754.1 TonB-dependent receptor [Hyphomicrobium sp. LHD-15]
MALAAVAPAMSASALAQTSTPTNQSAANKHYSFKIPSQPLGSALAAFSRVTGLSVLAGGSVPGSVVSPGVTGSHSPETALQQLLSGTGLTYSVSGSTVHVAGPGAGANDGAATLPGAIALDTIDVGGSASGAGFQGTPDWVYETPSSAGVVTREALKNVPARNTRDAITTAPGVYAGEGNGSFPTISPNIRGLQDSGRIVVSIDGARQNAQRGFGSGASGYQSNSGQAYVDSAFVREVDISKNPDAKAGSAASLGGGVNFRTVGADDLIPAGDTWGMEADITRGTNEYNFQGSALMATRIGEALSLTMGVSKTELGEYKPGQNGGEVASSGSFKGRDAWSSFLKLEGAFGDVKTSLSWMHQENEFQYGANVYTNDEDASNDSVTAKASWNPDNPLIDVNASLWLSDTNLIELRAARTGFYPETEIDSGFLSFGGVLENTSRLDTAVGALKLNYGVEAFRDKGTASAWSPLITQNPTWESAFLSFTPEGERDVASTFFNGEIKPASWVTISGGIRYDWSRLKGSPTYYERRPATFTNAKCLGSYYDYLVVYNPAILSSVPPPLINIFKTRCGEIYAGKFYNAGTSIDELSTPQQDVGHTLEIDRTDSAWLPSAMVEFKPVEWFRPFVSYGHSYRPPGVLDAFFTGSLPGNDLPQAFAPNVQLQAEQARTWEIGANIIRDGLLTETDSFRMKAVAFHREIDDFIVLGRIATAEATSPDKTYTSFVNLDDVTTMRGVEIEANYDFRVAWIGAGLSLLDTEWPKRTDIFSNGVVTTDGQVIAVPGAVPPEYKLTLDGGVRLLDERLVLGARYTRMGPTNVNTVDLNVGGDLVISENSKAYSLIDLYGSFAFSEHTALRFAVNNLMDINYVPATAAYNAPGRTMSVGFQIKY